MLLQLATRLNNVETFAIRELFKLLGKPGIISVVGGFPDPAMLQPQGGLFVWARLTGAGGKAKDGAELAKRAIDKGVAFVPGAPFYASKSNLATLRLSFATADVAKIEEGVGRLGQGI